MVKSIKKIVVKNEDENYLNTDWLCLNIFLNNYCKTLYNSL